ncbi:hypothetical protein C8Q79DRAFT_1012122 [Trametes meyenii]|nr:hypothetical protein C8Q79DRAFT_1012122 [Trametes meyenii]
MSSETATYPTQLGAYDELRQDQVQTLTLPPPPRREDRQWQLLALPPINSGRTRGPQVFSNPLRLPPSPECILVPSSSKESTAPVDAMEVDETGTYFWQSNMCSAIPPIRPIPYDRPLAQWPIPTPVPQWNPELVSEGRLVQLDTTYDDDLPMRPLRPDDHSSEPRGIASPLYPLPTPVMHPQQMGIPMDAVPSLHLPPILPSLTSTEHSARPDLPSLSHILPQTMGGMAPQYDLVGPAHPPVAHHTAHLGPASQAVGFAFADLPSKLPMVMEKDFDAVAGLIDPTVLRDFRAQDAGPMSLVRLWGLRKVPDHEIPGHCAMVAKGVTELTGELAPFVFAPTLTKAAKLDDETPLLLAVTGIWKSTVDNILSRIVWNSRKLTFFPISVKPRVTPYLYTLQGFKHNLNGSIANAVAAVFQLDHIRDYIHRLVSENPEYAWKDASLVTTEILRSASFRVTRLCDKSYIVTILCNSPTRDAGEWRAWRNYLRVHEVRNPFELPAIRCDPLVCRACHSCDHLTRHCPFPNLLGWCAPPPPPSPQAQDQAGAPLPPPPPPPLPPAAPMQRRTQARPITRAHWDAYAPYEYPNTNHAGPSRGTGRGGRSQNGGPRNRAN